MQSVCPGVAREVGETTPNNVNNVANNVGSACAASVPALPEKFFSHSNPADSGPSGEARGVLADPSGVSQIAQDLGDLSRMGTGVLDHLAVGDVAALVDLCKDPGLHGTLPRDRGTTDRERVARGP